MTISRTQLNDYNTGSKGGIVKAQRFR